MQDNALGLNPMQQAAVDYLDGPCLVLAGAGSGKTRVITQKIAYLLNTCGYQAKGVFAVTFTNKAAKEMLERIKPVVDKNLIKGLTVCTFHSLGVRFLREEAKAVGLKPQFSILDATDASAIIQDMLNTTDRGRIKAVQQTISLWKNQLVLPEQAELLAQTPDEVEVAHIYYSYQETLKAYQAVDFDDLVMLPVLIMQAHEDVRERWQKRVHYLLVDEYQDTNACQYEWVKLLVAFHQKFTLVGDDDQAIYAWRGATVENLGKLPKDYANLKLIKLEQNYRSVKTILDAANRVIAHNPNLYAKTLWSELGQGRPIQVVAMQDSEAEAETVGMRISAMHFEKQAKWSDFAVLYRSNHQSRVLEQTFRDLRIPYVLAGGQSFFDKAEIRDVLAYLRLIANEDDDPAFIRAITVPKKGVGQATLKALGELATELGQSLFLTSHHPRVSEHIHDRQLKPLHQFVDTITLFRHQAQGVHDPSQLFAEPPKPTDQLLDELIAFMGYERYLYETQEERAATTRWQNVLELVDWLKRKANENDFNLNELVQHIALITMLERSNEEGDSDMVKLTTIHASKGLEYPYVHLIGAEEGLLPHMGREDEYGDPNKEDGGYSDRIQEERRLMYVAITRAQKELTVTWCQNRRRARENVEREPSRFIAEMGLESGASMQKDPFAGMSPKERIARLKALLHKKD